MNLFTYGTLMFPEVWKRIAIGEFPARSATLLGYAAYRVRDALYPGIVRSGNGSFVEGLLYEGLDEDTLFELDTYESSFYERILVVVKTEDGVEHECHAYIVPESRRGLLTDERWDADHFSKHHLDKYLDGATGASSSGDSAT